MSTPAEPLAALLDQINGGRAAEALPALDRMLKQLPGHPAVLQLRAEALRLAGRSLEAIEAYKQAGEKGAGTRSWLAAGILLAAERATDDSLACLQKALGEAPDSEDVLDALITTLFNSNRQQEGIEFARRQLTVSSNPALLSRAALLLQGNNLYEESSDAFKRIIRLAPGDPTVLSSALVAARFTCEFDWIESLLQGIGAWYERGDFATPQEYPLAHLAWCADEALNLGVTRAYVERTVPRVTPIAAGASRRAGGRIRVGYLSCDFRNHATMHLMAGVLEMHDRERFEVFAYDYSVFDISDYRQRFLDAVEHRIPIHTLSDAEAAARIAQDQLDILFDLKGYTGGGRPGVLAYRPAPVQAAYLGFPGSAGSPDIDYVVSDRFVTPDSSAPYYTETFCRLPHSYQCNDRRRLNTPEPGPRSMYGLPEDKFVFGAFNQTHKVDRASFSLWLRILAEVPDSVLWLMGQSAAAIENLTGYARQAGIETGRLIFAPFAAPQDHRMRLPQADAVLDTLVYNGHTTTSDALWAGVPVITCRGHHFPSRVSESLLNAMEVPELVGADQDDMVRIARRLGTDTQYWGELRRKIAANRLTAPLFDTLRFTRNFESAIELMTREQPSGAARGCIDVPDCGPVRQAADAATVPVPLSPLLVAYPACPVCRGTSVTAGFANCSTDAQWHEPLPPSIEWMHCPACGHLHSRYHWSEAGLAEVLRNASPAAQKQLVGNTDSERTVWAPVVERAVALLGGYAQLLKPGDQPIWVDVGCGEGALSMTASDYGFRAIGLDIAAEAVTRIRELGFNVLQQDFVKLRFEIVPDVLSMMDVLAQIPYPVEALYKAAQVLRPGGVLVLSTPDFSSSSWKALELAKSNPYWTQLRYHHHFSRERLMPLLRDCGFEVADFAIPNRGLAHMEIYAVRR
jgi:protein O-GlcNAc transferase